MGREPGDAPAGGARAEQNDPLGSGRARVA
jgi:hypothetical protein